MTVPIPPPPQRRYNLLLLRQELQTAGIDLGALGSEGDQVFAFDPEGVRLFLPAEADPIIAAHDPTKRLLTDDQRDIIVRFKALQAAATFTVWKTAFMPLLWGILKRLMELQDADQS